MSGCGCEIEITDKEQKGTLITLLAINGFMFVFEIGLGWYAQSTGLIADSLDMLADAIVYAIGIYAIGKSLLHKANAALLSGYFQAALGLMILLDIIRRIFVGSEPVSLLMMVVGVIARRFVLARIIFGELAGSDAFVRDSELFAITVYETPTSSVTYTRD